MPFSPVPSPPLPSPEQTPPLMGRLFSKPVQASRGLGTTAVRTWGPRCKQGPSLEGHRQQHSNWAFCKERAGLVWTCHKATTPGSRG